MLPFFMACVLGTYLIWLTRWRRALAVIFGGLAGITPLLLYNATAFGNPLLNANIAGGYPDSYLHLSLHNFLAKAPLYFSETTFYDPLVWLGIAGLVFFPAAFRRERLVIAALFVVHAFQVLNIDTHGGCHYGPRFLLPLMPFATIALTGFYFLRTTMKRFAAILIAVVGIASVAINAVGAFSGAMYCEVQLYAVWPAVRLLRNGGHATFPLMSWLIVPALLSLVMLLYAIRQNRDTAQPV
jgi:hypothetical protein